MQITEKLYPGDVVLMRKAHPCGGAEWEVTRVGADIGMLCLTCKRRVMLSRRDFTRQARSFVRRGPGADAHAASAGDDTTDADSPAGNLPSSGAAAAAL